MTTSSTDFCCGRPGRMAFWQHRCRLAVASLALLLPGGTHAQSPRITSPAPARNYSVSRFSEKGYHSLHVRGASADLRDPKRVSLSDLTLSVYTGDASRRVESVLLSPQAIYQPETEVVSGPQSVRLVRDDLELTGEDWRYDHNTRTIVIERNARLVFQGSIPDLLK